jgi:hypothetical protein
MAAGVMLHAEIKNDWVEIGQINSMRLPPELEKKPPTDQY